MASSSAEALRRAPAARIRAWDEPPALELVDVREPGPDETLVALAAGAVAHIDLTVATGRFALRPALPHVPGTEGAGTVVRSGRFAEGTPVRIRGGRVGLERDGCWAAFVTAPDEALVELPAGTDLALAAGFFSPCVTAHAAIHELGALAPGERVAIVGAAGAVGAVAVQLARRAGAGEIQGVERDAARAADLPPDVVCVEAPAQADLLIDMAGGPDLAQRIITGVRPGGRAVLVGYTAGTESSFHLPALLAADVRLLPMNLIRWEQRLRDVAAELLGLLRDGELELMRTVLPLERVADAARAVRDGTARGRVIVTTH